MGVLDSSERTADGSIDAFPIEKPGPRWKPDTNRQKIFARAFPSRTRTLFYSRLSSLPLPKHREKRGLGKQFAIEQQRMIGSPADREVVEPALTVVQPPKGHATNVLPLT